MSIMWWKEKQNEYYAIQVRTIKIDEFSYNTIKLLCEYTCTYILYVTIQSK